MKKSLFLFCLILQSFYLSAQNEQLIKIAKSGDIDAQLYLAESYFYGKDGIKKNIHESYKWYEAAAAQGNGYAEFKLYRFYLDLRGTWTATEMKEALVHLEKSFKLDYIPAVYEYARMGIIQNKADQAMGYLMHAVNSRYPPAYATLADCYYYGKGVRENVDEAIKYYQKGIDEGINYCFLGMAYCYYWKKKDYKKALDYYQKAIESDITQAYNDLAYMYAEGKGVNRNFKEAHRLVDLAISRDPSEANFYDSKGEFYLMEGLNEKAKEMWNKVVALDSNALERTDPLALAMNNSVDNNIPETDIKSEMFFAVIIANQNYKRVSAVPFANNDGKTFSEYCKRTLGIPENHIFYVEDATLGDMRYHINLVKKITDAYKGEARLIFYYAGHGIPDENEKTAYLLPVDGYANDATSGLSLKDLYLELESIHAKSVLVFLDACFSGAKRDGDMLMSARGVAIKPKIDSPKGNMLVMSAAQGDETAYPYKEKNHGLFTFFLLKKLQETRGDVTLGELADYVTSEVKKQSVLINEKMQTPLVAPSEMAVDWRNWKLR